MIEFIGLCVCSACLSCICCLITGGLCLLPCSTRLRNKIIEKHCSEDMHWLGNLRPCDVCGSDTISSSECSFVPDDCERSGKSSCKIPEEKASKCLKECSVDREAEKRKSKKSETGKPCDKSKPKRWTFCFNLGKPSQESSQCCAAVKDDPIESCDRNNSCKKKSKKCHRTRKHDPEAHYAYFKSCSCTNVVRSTDKRCSDKRKKRSEPSSTKCPPECCTRVDKRRSKKCGDKKSRKNCLCEILAEYENSIICYDSRDVEPYCKCCPKKMLATTRRCGR